MSLEDYIPQLPGEKAPTSPDVAFSAAGSEIVPALIGPPLLRHRGLSIYYHDNIHGIPQAFVEDVACTSCLAETVVIMTVRQVHQKLPPTHAVEQNQSFCLVAHQAWQALVCRAEAMSIRSHTPAFVAW